MPAGSTIEHFTLSVNVALPDGTMGGDVIGAEYTDPSGISTVLSAIANDPIVGSFIAEGARVLRVVRNGKAVYAK